MSQQAKPGFLEMADLRPPTAAASSSNPAAPNEEMPNLVGQFPISSQTNNEWNVMENENHPYSDGRDEMSSDGNNDNTPKRTSCHAVCHNSFLYPMRKQGSLILYISAFSIIGSTIRVYLGRIFGLDCEFPPEQEDFISKMSMCITATGLTEQRGGALFIDLPANMLGSFLLGIMTPTHVMHNNNTDNEPIMTAMTPKFPWLHRTHWLQNCNTAHVSLTVALCGSMTTYSSWNSQMVMMMVGKDAILGSQIGAAIAGYVLGLVCALASFSFGQIVARAMARMGRGGGSSSSSNSLENLLDDSSGQNKEKEMQEDDNLSGHIHANNSSDVETLASRTDTKTTTTTTTTKSIERTPRNIWNKICRAVNVMVHGKFMFLILVCLILILFLIGDLHMNSSFHKQMWISSLLSPPGTILRWQLSRRLNHQTWFTKTKQVHSRTAISFPYGTLIANICGCIISILAVGMMGHWNNHAATLWLGGIKTGFAGNLSTVSTFAKEIVWILQQQEIEKRLCVAFSYVLVTMVAASLLSLGIYIIFF